MLALCSRVAGQLGDVLDLKAVAVSVWSVGQFGLVEELHAIPFFSCTATSNLDTFSCKRDI